MSTITASPISGLTDEQRDFQAAIRDFAERECGTGEQREQLTNGYERAAQPGDLREARPSSAGSGSPIDEAYGGAGGGDGRRLHLPRGDDARPGPDRRLRRQPDRRRRLRALRHRGAEAGDPRRHLPGPGRGDRDVRAGGRAPTSARSPARPSSQNGGYVLNGQKTWISRRPHRRPHPRHRPLRQLGLQARGPDDVLGPDRRRGRSRSAGSRRWAARRSTTSS